MNIWFHIEFGVQDDWADNKSNSCPFYLSFEMLIVTPSHFYHLFPGYSWRDVYSSIFFLFWRNTQSIKSLCQCDSFNKSLAILFVFIYSELKILWVQQKRSDILVLLWQKCQLFNVYYLWLKNLLQKSMHFLWSISELMASNCHT